MAAMAAGDLAAVVSLLHPDVTFTGDSNGKAPTAVHVIHGPDKVARFLFGLAIGTDRGAGVEPAGAGQRRLGATPPARGGDGSARCSPMIAMTVRDGKVCAIWDIANPDKFTARHSRALGGPRNPACVTGIEALLGDPERGVHPGSHVLDADLVRRLDHALVAEAAP